MYLSTWNTFLLIISFFDVMVATRLIIKVQLKGIYMKITSLIFKSNFSKYFEISELIYGETLVFLQSLLFSKEYSHLLKCFERFFLLLPPVPNCSNYCQSTKFWSLV